MKTNYKPRGVSEKLDMSKIIDFLFTKKYSIPAFPELPAAFRLVPRFPWPTPEKMTSLLGETVGTSRKTAGRSGYC